MYVRVCASLLAAAVLLSPAAGCKRKRGRIRVGQTDEEGGSMASVIHVADPRASAQLLAGFHSVEQNSWRWTMKKFSVALRPPRAAAQKGAVLELKFSLPEAVLSRLKVVSISASVAGTRLSPETYTQAGEFRYLREIDPKLLDGDVVNVEFELDKAIAAGELENRELGVIVSTVGLEPK